LPPRQLVTWCIVSACVLVIVIVMIVSIAPASAELCLAKIDNAIERKSNYRWQWATVDGRKCWYYSNTPTPKEDLIWSYTSHEFDSDIDRVLERKHYGFDENNLLLERK
jgi:hypothetical protein